MNDPATPGPSVTPLGLRRSAPAKINLSLKILGRRDDGYHLLDSLVAFADIGDRVSAAPAGDLSLCVTGPRAGDLAGLPSDDNLVLRAARALRRLSGVRAGAALTLEKHLPAAGGIGGGSSDAAAALRALTTLWNVAPDPAALAEAALTLGADVPVCLACEPARMGGIGERLTPVGPLAPAGVLLVNPGVATPTGTVFRALRGRISAPSGTLGPLGPTARDLAATLRGLGNDLTDPAIETTPSVGSVLQALTAEPESLFAAMSGSGATCFALTEDRASAEALAARLRGTAPGAWWIAAGALLTEGVPE
ncbi:MAG: 4-(cytidine 5'-diphospho)-2-C-methyl-D-erythritol kinase [Marivibrio sp.]|uniref:4-(cytidine 5'-diphospho)-2-C-methyl-D-erythritol kinase n=1 Tax=Marivibrio sp. TaxID=2039719 RepID=UPI0032EE051C